ncbi:alpha/beta hydrolase family protein [Angustibacter peucedani]
MALVRVDWFSEVLEMGTSTLVLLPQATTAQIGVDSPDDGAAGGEEPVAAQGFPTLYLLHGLSDDATAWTRYTSVERFTSAAGLAVVMPQVGRSFYTDAAHGGRWWTHVSEELPQVMRSFFRLSSRREDTFVAGLSMGGYGAMKWALRRPQDVAAAASLSGALDLAARQGTGDLYADIESTVFDGRRVEGSDDDLLALLRGLDAAGRAALPRLYVGCGTEDHLLPENERFLALAAERGVDVTTDLRPGEHEWGLWDRVVRDVVDWLPRR